jgi:transposase-like protein
MAGVKRDAQYQQDALSGRRNLGVHSSVGGVSIELRHLEEMREERGVFVDHASINRWAIRFLPLLE